MIVKNNPLNLTKLTSKKITRSMSAGYFNILVY